MQGGAVVIVVYEAMVLLGGLVEKPGVEVVCFIQRSPWMCR